MNKHRQLAIAAVVLFGLCCASYSNGLQGEFMIDDYSLIVDNSRIHSLKYAGEVFTGHLSTTDLHYRPLSSLVRICLYQIFKTDAWKYHAFNLFLFFLNCLLIFILIRIVAQDHLIAGMVSALFAVHPINSVMVNYITAHEFLLFAIFMFLSLIFYLKYDDENRKSVYLRASIGCFTVSLLFHEVVIIFPLFLM